MPKTRKYRIIKVTPFEDKIMYKMDIPTLEYLNSIYSIFLSNVSSGSGIQPEEKEFFLKLNDSGEFQISEDPTNLIFRIKISKMNDGGYRFIHELEFKFKNGKNLTWWFNKKLTNGHYQVKSDLPITFESKEDFNSLDKYSDLLGFDVVIEDFTELEE